MKIGFIGLGNMATAVIEGILKSKMFSSSDILGSAKTSATCDKCAAKYDIKTSTSNYEIASQVDILVLAVKPQFLEEVCAQIKEAVTENTLVISLAAGKDIAWICDKFGEKTRVMRLMPNTPALIGESCTAVCQGAFATKDDVTFTMKLTNSFGTARVIDEKLMNAFIGVAGSSVAYTFMYLEALADAAVAAGMPRSAAYEFAAQSTLGAAKLMLETKEHPGVLKDMVCSPAGATIAAVKALEDRGFRGTVMSGVEACIDKASKL
ncbi:MAG: pyrroline-5-carboxylate reductase [Lachnospiraceae bacterium]